MTLAFAAAALALALGGCVSGSTSHAGSTSNAGSTTSAGSSNSTTSQSSGHETPDPANVRTIRVFDIQPAPSPSARVLQAGLEKGKLPAGQVKATVLTDEDCEPDQQGISHCENKVRLADGTTLVLRHPHDMHKVPCLAPGEEVLLQGA